MKLYLVRHGETFLNKYGRMQGWADTPLTEQGKQIAYECGKELAAVPFDAVISSDLGRTIETAEIMMEQLQSRTPLLSMPDFRETFFGSYEGEIGSKAWQEVAEKNGFSSLRDFYSELTIEEIMDAFRKADPTGDADDYITFWTRIEKGLETLLAQYPQDETILLVTHGNTIRNIAFQFDRRINCSEELLNAGITLVEITGSEKTVHFYNQRMIRERITDEV